MLERLRLAIAKPVRKVMCRVVTDIKDIWSHLRALQSFDTSQIDKKKLEQSVNFCPMHDVVALINTTVMTLHTRHKGRVLVVSLSDLSTNFISWLLYYPVSLILVILPSEGKSIEKCPKSTFESIQSIRLIQAENYYITWMLATRLLQIVPLQIFLLSG